MKIIIYSTPTCPWCVLAKNYFKNNGIPFEDVDVASDQKKAQEMVDLSGQLGVPVIKIDDQVIIGFNKEQIEKILAEKKN